MLDRDSQKLLNSEALLNPQPGDYWSEMLCGTCIILEVTDDQIVLCKTKEFSKEDCQQWRFDLTKLHKTTKSQLASWLSYKGRVLTWADVRRLGERSSELAEYRELRESLTLSNLPTLLTNSSAEHFVKGLDNPIKSLCLNLKSADQFELDPELVSKINKTANQLEDLHDLVKTYL